MEAEQQRIQVLTHQNQRLALQLEEKRRDTKRLEEKVSHYEARDADYAQTLLCVNRLWEQLQNDIQHLCKEACSKSAEPAAKRADGPASSDPFLARLLKFDCPTALTKAVTDGAKQLDANRSSIESALVERCASTQGALAEVLEYVQRLHAQRMELSQQLAGQCSDRALKEEHQKVLAEAAALRRQLDHGHAQQRTTVEQLQVAEDRQLETEDAIKKLQNELADTEQQLSSLQRKYAALKEGQAGDTGFPPHHAAVKGEPGAAAGGCGSGSGAPHAGASQEDAGEDAQHVHKMLQSRTAELEKEREAHMVTRRELQEAASKLGDELWVPATRCHQQLTVELQRLTEQLAAKAKEVEGTARERDEAVREVQVKNHFFQAESVCRAKLQAVEKAYRELQQAKLEGDRQRQEQELALQRERDKGGSSKTVPELKAMIVTLQAQVSSLQQHLKLNMVTQERLASSSQEVLTAQCRLESKEQELQRLSDRLRRKDLELEEQRRREQGLKERINDLKAFVDVLTVYCNDPRDVAEVRASEVALREQVASLKGQLEGHGLQQRIKELEAAEQVCRDQVDLVGLEGDSLRVELSRQRGEAAELDTQLQAARSECQLYIAEIETMGTAYEDMQSQNARLLQKLTERDDAHNQLLAERLKLVQVQQHLQEQLESKAQELERAVRDQVDMQSLKEGLDKEVARLAGELLQAKEAARQHASRADATALEVRRRDELAAVQAAATEGLQKQLGEVRSKLEEAHEKLIKEKTKKQKLEDESKLLNVKLDRLRKTATTGTVARELQEEIEAMRQLINCNVCHERQKNVIITKCCHVFCDKCIKKNLEARNRKCPGCGVPFGQADVKQFYYT